MKSLGAILTVNLMEGDHLKKHWGKYLLGAGALAAGAAYAPELTEKYHEHEITRHLKKALDAPETKNEFSPYMKKVAAKVQKSELGQRPPTMSDLEQKWSETSNPDMKKAIEHQMSLRSKNK